MSSRRAQHTGDDGDGSCNGASLGAKRWAEDEGNTQLVPAEGTKDHDLVAEGESFVLLTSLLSKFPLRKRRPPGSWRAESPNIYGEADPNRESGRP